VAGFKELGAQLSNWHRWGPDDQIGTLNFITPQRLAAAARAVTDGKVFDLGAPFDTTGLGFPRPNPVHTMTAIGALGIGEFVMGEGAAFSDDYIAMHLQCATHWDALSHYLYDGQMYNGFGIDQVTPEQGARKLGIEHAVTHSQGRGVLLDVPGLLGVDWLDLDHAITPDELDRCAADQGVELRPGDILCVRTGWRRRQSVEGATLEWATAEPGLGLACARWLHEHEIAAVASDNWGVEIMAMVPPAAGHTFAPLHCVLLRDLGMPLGELFDFEALTADCRADGRWDFLLSGTPLKVPGAVGAPTTPIAIK
jgi:kynurenine formamidase